MSGYLRYIFRQLCLCEYQKLESFSNCREKENEKIKKFPPPAPPPLKKKNCGNRTRPDNE